MVVVIADTDDARAIYKDPLTIKPAILYNVMSQFSSGPSILSLSGGEEWHHRRKGMNPAFAPKCIKAMNQVALQVASDWGTGLLVSSPCRTPGQEESKSSTNVNKEVISFDVGKEMLKITILVICRAALDYPISQEESQWLLTEIPLAWIEFSLKDGMNPLRRFLTWMLPERQRAYIAARRIHEFAYRVIEHYRQNKKNNAPTSTTSPSSQTVIEAIMENPNYKNDNERASDIIMIVFAGHDTTGFTLALALLELAKHPEEQARLRRALTTTPPSSPNNHEAGIRTEPQETASWSSVETDSSSSSGFLKAVISETMRLYPVVTTPGVKTLGRGDYVTQHGNYFIPKGSIVFMAQIAIARDPSIFEQDPFEYRPSRWLMDEEDNSSKEKVKQKSALFPFSLGNRNCIGQPLANAELYTILPYYLIQRFEFSVEDEGQLLVPSLVRLENCRLQEKKIYDAGVSE